VPPSRLASVNAGLRAAYRPHPLPSITIIPLENWPEALQKEAGPTTSRPASRKARIAAVSSRSEAPGSTPGKGGPASRTRPTRLHCARTSSRVPPKKPRSRSLASDGSALFAAGEIPAMIATLRMIARCLAHAVTDEAQVFTDILCPKLYFCRGFRPCLHCHPAQRHLITVNSPVDMLKVGPRHRQVASPWQ
jgi:hypothetical protein